jgi:hypothetical protein
MRAQRNNHNGSYRGFDGRSRVHHDTERAVIRIRSLRVDVRHLHYGQQSQQDQADNRHHRCVARNGKQLAAPVGLSSAQDGSVSSLIQEYTEWAAECMPCAKTGLRPPL